MNFEIFLITVDQEMIIPEWLFQLPIIEPERTEFWKIIFFSMQNASIKQIFYSLSVETGSEIEDLSHYQPFQRITSSFCKSFLVPVCYLKKLLSKEFRIDEIKIISIHTKMLNLWRFLGTKNCLNLFLDVFILWLGRNSLFLF